MGILSFFRRKKETSVTAELPELPPLPSSPPIPKPEATIETSSIENLRVKIDLVLTHIDSLKTQYETLNERIKNIEQMVQEIRSYYYSYRK
ncbi:MAG: hypothetical protein NZ942_00725 [Candidatus Aenigmarchaeota archaeon]|nr:hypothetical protein [Candidatus Aenigmarchaeota archaeon]